MMETPKIRFLNATSFSVDADFLIYFEKWNDWGYTNICRISGKGYNVPFHLTCCFRVIDISGDNNKTHGHILNMYANQIFTQLPQSYVSVVSDIKGCESILLCLSPSQRKLLLDSLNVCFPTSAYYKHLVQTDAFKKSVLRERLLDDVVNDMMKCQELLTCPLDIHQMLVDKLK